MCENILYFRFLKIFGKRLKVSLKTHTIKNKRIFARGVYKTFIFKTVLKINKACRKKVRLRNIFLSINFNLHISTINGKRLCN